MTPMLGIMASSRPTSAPPPVAGFSLWLDATNAGSFTFSSGVLVSQWSDLSGNGYHFSQATSVLQPSRNNNLQNGLPSVSFSTDCLTNNSWDWSASDYTVFAVINNRTGTVYDGTLSRDSVSALQLGYDNANKYAISRIGIATSACNLGGTGTNADVVVYKGSARSGGSTTVQIYKNATAASSTVTVSSLIAGGPNVLGATNSAAADPIVGYISEFIIYPSQLSNTDRNLVEAYLKAKWATP